MENLGRIHSYETFGAVDGPGIRFVVFMQGCPLRCKYCHNPDTWDFAKGEQKTPQQVMDKILDYKNFIKTGGVTISGGEPLAQPKFCAELLRLCKQNGLHTAIDTSGAVPLKNCKDIIDLADMLLLDIKSLDEDVCIDLTGLSNKNALEILDYCEKVQKPIWIRHVVVDGYTNDEEKITRLADFLNAYKCVKKVELLPFHKMGEFKWNDLGLDYKLADTQPPDMVDVKRYQKLFLQKD
ncbi:MAG: pyruvate formate lyase-activating protein [Oscillospiraceae bacterium]|nr:pyruvate formate lyase-activating protein [Oscillospiraceae bacterium]